MEFRRVLFRSARGRGTEVGRTEVAVAVDQGVAQREVLRHADEGVVDAAVAVGVVLAHHLAGDAGALHVRPVGRSEEHTSELQSLMRISYAVFCLKKKKQHQTTTARLTTQ